MHVLNYLADEELHFEDCDAEAKENHVWTHRETLRQMLEGDEAKEDVNRSQQIIRQTRMELEQVLQVLKR